MIASAGDPCKIQLWNISTGECSKTLNHANSGLVSHSRIVSLAYSKMDDKEFLFAGSYGKICLVEVPKSDTKVDEKISSPTTKTLFGHRRGIWALEFDPKRNNLASAGADGDLNLWAIGHEKGLENCQKLWSMANLHSQYVRGLKFLNREGTLLASCGQDSSVVVTDCIKKKKVQSATTSGSLFGLDYNHEDQMLYCCRSNGDVHLYDVRGGQLTAKLKWKMYDGSKLTKSLWSILYVTDGISKELIIGDRKNTLTIFDLRKISEGISPKLTVINRWSGDGKIVKPPSTSGAGGNTVMRLMTIPGQRNSRFPRIVSSTKNLICVWERNEEDGLWGPTLDECMDFGRAVYGLCYVGVEEDKWKMSKNFEQSMIDLRERIEYLMEMVEIGEDSRVKVKWKGTKISDGNLGVWKWMWI